MGKVVYLAVAGAGKTTQLVGTTAAGRRTLLLTYTVQNVGTLRDKVIARFGFVPSSFDIMTLDRYLYSYCFKPILGHAHRAKILSYDHDLPRLSGLRRYISPGGALYRGRLSKLLIEHGASDITRRLNKYYEQIVIDEIQDFAGHDFDLLEHLTSGNIDVVAAGDFYQHTFDSSTDGNKGSALYADYAEYQRKLRDFGLTVDTTSLKLSRRCPATLCSLIRDRLGISIEPASSTSGQVKFVNDPDEIRRLHSDDSIVKLFWEKHAIYECYSNNWKRSKGLDAYTDVCVVLTEPAHRCLTDGTAMSKGSRNALYVALTRTRTNTYLIRLKDFKRAI